jgi:polyvinyl alcohol dehydrogenase (cytochrome)
MLLPFLSARRRRPAPRARLAVEALENRLVPSGVDVVSGDPNDWPMYNHDAAGSRYNQAEHTLSPSTVGNLAVKWSYPTHGPIAGTPAVVNDRVYAADALGYVYALDRNGNQLWERQLDVGVTASRLKVTASALVTNRTVVIGDQSGRIHGLDVDTGAEKWTTAPDNPAQFPAIWGSATMVGHYVAVGISSNEWAVAGFVPGYTPTFRGSLVLLDPSDGHVVWQTFTITAAENAAGATGAAVWGTPTYDRALNTIFAGTSNNYTQPTTGTSDAFIAFNASTGAIRWVNQRTHDDEWNFTFGDSSPAHPDFDIADSPQVYKIGGRTVVAAGQKSGFFHVLDAATGAEVSPPLQVAPGGTIGGLFADSAYADGVNYANGVDWPGLLGGAPPHRGILSAISADGSHELWHFDTPFSPNIAGVAVANGVVYLQSMFGQFYALDAHNGNVLASVTTGAESSGPAISRGQIYLGTGASAFQFIVPQLPLSPSSIIALGLPDGNAPADPARPLTGQGSGNFTDAAGDFVASGIAMHLGAFTHTGTLTFTPTADPNVVAIGGTSVYIAANGDRLYASLSGTLNLATGVASGTDTWTGGTGRFAHAHGSASLSGQVFPDGSFVFTLAGDISY